MQACILPENLDLHPYRLKARLLISGKYFDLQTNFITTQPTLKDRVQVERLVFSKMVIG